MIINIIEKIVTKSANTFLSHYCLIQYPRKNVTDYGTEIKLIIFYFLFYTSLLQKTKTHRWWNLNKILIGTNHFKSWRICTLGSFQRIYLHGLGKIGLYYKNEFIYHLEWSTVLWTETNLSIFCWLTSDLFKN